MKRDHTKALIWFWLTLAASIVAVVLSASCASITPVYEQDGIRLRKIEASKFMADVEYEEEFEFADDGKTILKRRVKYKTATNFDKIMNGMAGLFGTLFNGASQVMP